MYTQEISNGLSFYIPPLLRLSFTYCSTGGSSRGIKQFIASGKFVSLAKRMPHVEFLLRPKQGSHPTIKAVFGKLNHCTSGMYLLR